MTQLDPAVTAALVQAARSACERSYAPYSKFRAGAAVLRSDGGIVTGSIVENISLGLAMCAERVAMFAAATSSTPRSPIDALVLAAPDTGPRRTWPCGACRQVAIELGGPELLVAAVGRDTLVDDVEWRRLGDLVPDAPHRS